MEFTLWLEDLACPVQDLASILPETQMPILRIATPIRYEEATVFDLLSPYQRLEEPRLGRRKP